MTSTGLSTLFGDGRQVAVERAVAEFRAARPVWIEGQDVAVVACPLEGVSAGLLSRFKQHDARLIIPRERARVSPAWHFRNAAVTLKPLTEAAIEAYLAGPSPASLASAADPAKPTIAEDAALTLARLAQLLPAVLCARVEWDDVLRPLLMSLSADAIAAFRDRDAKALRIISRAFVPLDGAVDCEFIVFRGGDGFRDQVAVRVGSPPLGEPLLVRIHSACLTGDLFGSLKCDCGEQLRGTVRLMQEKGGGVIVYLDQEGRGNGLANKIRAYHLQDQGYDTYEADSLLGFGPDQRRYDFAGEMLKQLGTSSVRLMTNNPEKADALREAGLDVVSTHRIYARPSEYNLGYLKAKRDKGGHFMEGQALNGLDQSDSEATVDVGARS